MEIITEAGPVSNEGGFPTAWAVHDVTISSIPYAWLWATFLAG